MFERRTTSNRGFRKMGRVAWGFVALAACGNETEPQYVVEEAPAASPSMPPAPAPTGSSALYATCHDIGRCVRQCGGENRSSCGNACVASGTETAKRDYLALNSCGRENGCTTAACVFKSCLPQLAQCKYTLARRGPWTCADLYGCNALCWDSSCAQDCYRGSTAAAEGSYIDLTACANQNNCSDSSDTTCLRAACLEQVRACDLDGARLGDFGSPQTGSRFSCAGVWACVRFCEGDSRCESNCNKEATSNGFVYYTSLSFPFPNGQDCSQTPQMFGCAESLAHCLAEVIGR